MSLIEKALGKQRAAGGRTEFGLASAGDLRRGVGRGTLVLSRKIALPSARLVRQGLLTTDEDAPEIANEFRVIKRPVVTNAFGRDGPALPRGRMVVVTSAFEGEGKTFTTLNLALALALERDVSVLLVDGDAAKQGLSHAMGIDGEPGLLDAIGSRETRLDPFIIGTDHPGVMVLPAGKRQATASELLSSRTMITLFDDLLAREPSLVVLFDSSPLLSTTDARSLVAAAGQTVLVVHAGITPRECVIEALACIGADRYRSAILNQCPPRSRDFVQYGQQQTVQQQTVVHAYSAHS